jgi:hypothetical protein
MPIKQLEIAFVHELDARLSAQLNLIFQPQTVMKIVDIILEETVSDRLYTP